MNTFQIITITIVALIHLYILVLEMFLWTTKKGMKAFGLRDIAFAEATKVLAANQGLYNGFLAAGLVYAIITLNKEVAVLFLVFVMVAGLYGSYSTRNKKIILIQSLPALLAILTLIYSGVLFK